MFPTPEIWGMPMYVRGVRVCQGVRVHSPLGPLGVSGNGARGPCTRQGTDSAPFGMFPTPECWGVSMYVGVAVHVGQLPCTRPLADLVARRYVARFHFRSECFLIVFDFGRRSVACRPLAES